MSIFLATALASLSAAVQPTATPELLAPPSSPAEAPFGSWQREIAKGYLPYHELTVDDFRIDNDAHPEGSYWVQPFVHYYYLTLFKKPAGNTVYAYIMEWTVLSGFDKNLSSRKAKFHNMKSELPYAQAILDINELFARHLAALQPGELPRGEGRSASEARRQLQYRLSLVYQKEVLEGVKRELAKLEEVTNHGQDKTKVHEMAAEISKRLAAIPPLNSPSPSQTPIPTPTSTPSIPTGGRVGSLPKQTGKGHAAG